mgnify:CR=1 FL=1|tara:strand:- start:717 stop:992 length:276 start_codon:yes stop_codon:yes gene_type:complete
MEQSRAPAEQPDDAAAGNIAGSNRSDEPGAAANMQGTMRDIKRKISQSIKRTANHAQQKKLRNCDFELRNISPTKKVILSDIYQSNFKNEK